MVSAGTTAKKRAFEAYSDVLWAYSSFQCIVLNIAHWSSPCPGIRYPFVFDFPSISIYPRRILGAANGIGKVLQERAISEVIDGPLSLG